jgi:peptide/nickel transport system substrate-binding protein
MSGQRLAVWAAAGVVGAAALAGCSSGSGTGGGSGALAGTAAADTWNNGTAQTGGKVTWSIDGAMQNWNAMSASGASFDTVQVLNGIYPGAFATNPSYQVTLNSDLLSSATGTGGGSQSGTGPQTVVYQIKNNAVWSDGTPITADDFAYTWRVQNGTDANIQTANTLGYSQVKSVTGSNAGKTVTVVFSSAFPDWKSLFTHVYPAHVAAEHGTDEQSFAWFSANPPKVSGGPFTVATVSSDKTEVDESKNARYYGAPANLDQVDFRAITDQSLQVAALESKEVDGIYPQPTAALVSQLKSLGRQVTYKVDTGMEYEHIDFNLKNSALADPKWGRTLRTAMFTAVNRNEVLAKTVRPVQPTAVALNNRMLVPGQAGYQDDVAAYGLGTGDLAKARALLTAAGFTGADAGKQLTAPGGEAVPAFTMVYSMGNTVRQTTCQLFAAAMADLGITVNVQPTDDMAATLTQSSPGYSYDIVDFASVASPFPDSASRPAYTSGGGGDFGGYSNKNVDAWLKQAASATDQSAAAADLDKADQQISQDAYTLPLYQKPTLIAFQPGLVNVHNNVTESGPTYNVGDWGLKKTS